jgi:hypothetical protein
MKSSFMHSALALALPAALSSIAQAATLLTLQPDEASGQDVFVYECSACPASSASRRRRG